MSITFSLQTPSGDFLCSGHGRNCTVAEHLLDPYNMPGVCYDCREVELDACELCSLDVNMANGNAALVLERLGVEFDYCGSIDPAELLGRAMVGNIGRDDSGVASSEDRGEGGAAIIDCGLRPGYFADRFGALADLATAAIERGAVISWG